MPDQHFVVQDCNNKATMIWEFPVTDHSRVVAFILIGKALLHATTRRTSILMDKLLFALCILRLIVFMQACHLKGTKRYILKQAQLQPFERKQQQPYLSGILEWLVNNIHFVIYAYITFSLRITV